MKRESRNVINDEHCRNPNISIPSIIKAIHNPNLPKCSEFGGKCWEKQGDQICSSCYENPNMWPVGGECWNCERLRPINDSFRNGCYVCVVCEEEENNGN